MSGCGYEYATLGVGTGLLVGGLLVTAAGVTLLALPARQVALALPGTRR